VDPPTTDEREAARTQLGLEPGDFVGVYLAALDPHKEPLVAAQAAHAAFETGVPVVLLFVGDGPLRGEVENLARQSRAIRVLGFRRDTLRIFAAADFFVLPSRREGLSFALLEAMAAGLPPIVSDAPGNRDAIGDAGIAVPCGDVAAFGSALKRLAVDERERHLLAERAKARIEQQFSSHEMVSRTREIYKGVLRRAWSH
jgi:glycosyltransferase involved in cell wall biosynthesis